MSRLRRRGRAAPRNKTSSLAAGRTDADAASPSETSRARVWRSIAAYTLLLLVAALGLRWFILRSGPQNGEPPAASKAVATYVGSEECADCHQQEYSRWKESHHALAMATPDANTVLGDFRDIEFDKHGTHTRFFKRGDQFVIRTEGPDGRSGDYPVRFTFGWTPLQQYLVQLPGGRLQALTTAWDSREQASGGQRWFDLYPDERIDHRDPLHWSGPYLNWNFMCADCHSTNVRHNFDAKSNRFDTQWSEINVACESCHGAGSRHLEWARRQAHFWNRWLARDDSRGLTVGFDPTPDVERRASMRNGKPPSFAEGAELRACAVCHSRRTAITNEFLPEEGFDQHYLPALLADDLYYVDGQIKDEVYEYNSFRQSRMFAHGVTCSDCHDPHSATLRADRQAVCLQCHEGARYTASTHHHHGETGSGHAPDCVDCHMPQRTYMVVDPRRDHSFRVPRPDLTQRLGVPNACQSCHAGRPQEWAAARVKEWLGRDATGFQQFADALHAIRMTDVGAEEALRTLLRDRSVPPLVKGTALSEASELLHAIREELPRSLDSPFVPERLGAIQAIAPLPTSERWQLARQLLEDPERNVRIEAARILVDQDLRADQTQRLQPALGELMTAARTYASRPHWRMISATVHAKLGQTQLAIEDFEAALAIQPSAAQAYANLADLYRSLGQEDKAAETLARGLRALPDDAPLHYSEGLYLVRQGRNREGIDSIRRAVTLSPADPTFAYGYALGLYSLTPKRKAFDFLQQRLAEHPTERSSLYLLVQLALQEHTPELLAPQMAALRSLARDDPNARQLLNALEATTPDTPSSAPMSRRRVPRR